MRWFSGGGGESVCHTWRKLWFCPHHWFSSSFLLFLRSLLPCSISTGSRREVALWVFSPMVLILFFNHYFIILVPSFVCFLISSLSTPISGECTNNKNWNLTFLWRLFFVLPIHGVYRVIFAFLLRMVDPNLLLVTRNSSVQAKFSKSFVVTLRVHKVSVTPHCGSGQSRHLT